MSRAWYVLDREGQVLAGPFTGETAERKALSETWRLMRDATRRGEFVGMLTPTRLPITVGEPITSVFASASQVPRETWAAQAQGRLVVVFEPDGTASVFG